MKDELAPYQEGKYYNFRNLFFTKLGYNFGGIYYFISNNQKVMKMPFGRGLVTGFIFSTFVLDYFMIKEFMKNRDRTDCMFA